MIRNQNGFTLVELLAVFAILGIIMSVAIPNVMGILDKNKKNTYIEHAKEMIALAEYKMSADNSIQKPTSNEIIVFSLECLDTQDIEVGPDGAKYDLTESFVAIKNNYHTYEYYVTLRESLSNGARGLELISYDELNKSIAINHVKELSSSYINGNTILGVSGTVVYSC